MVNKEKNLRPTKLSPSCIDCFSQCLLKFWYRYHTKEKPVMDNIALRFGSAVHSAMEQLAGRLLRGDSFSAELCEEVAQDFIKLAAKYRISDNALIQEGQDMIRSRFYKHNPNYKIIATELNYSRMKLFTTKGTPLNGIIDLVLEADPNTAIILDYKTSRVAKTIDQCKSDVQLSMYDLMFSKSHPHYVHTWLALDFLRSDVIITDRTLDERQRFELWLDSLWEELGDLHEKDVEPTLNEYCAWCDYKHLCHEYQGVLNHGGIKVTPATALKDDSEFTTEWKKAKALEKMAKSRVDELKEWANARVHMEGLSKFENDESVVSWTQGNRTFYDVQSLVPHIPPQDLARLVSIKNAAIEAYVLHERPDLKSLLDKAARVTPGSPRVTVRNK